MRAHHSRGWDCGGARERGCFSTTRRCRGAVALSEANPVMSNGQPTTSAVLKEGDVMTLGARETAAFFFITAPIGAFLVSKAALHERLKAGRAKAPA